MSEWQPIEHVNHETLLHRLVSELSDLMGDFDGVTDDVNDPDRLHDWNWLSTNYRLNAFHSAWRELYGTSVPFLPEPPRTEP